jgi:hypothetical protein
MINGTQTRDSAATNKQTNDQTNQLIKQLHGAESFLGRHQSLFFSRITQDSMEPEVSLPRSQKPAAAPYPEPDESSPHNLIL